MAINPICSYCCILRSWRAFPMLNVIITQQRGNSAFWELAGTAAFSPSLSWWWPTSCSPWLPRWKGCKRKSEGEAQETERCRLLQGGEYLFLLKPRLTFNNELLLEMNAGKISELGESTMNTVSLAEQTLWVMSTGKACSPATEWNETAGQEQGERERERKRRLDARQWGGPGDKRQGRRLRWGSHQFGFILYTSFPADSHKFRYAGYSAVWLKPHNAVLTLTMHSEAKPYK